MIREIDNPLLLNKILELAKNIPDTPLPTLEKMLIEALTSKEAKIFIDEKNNEIRGFIYASVEQWQGEDVVFIQFTVIKPIQEERYIGFEFITKMKLWAKEKGIKSIITVVKRNPKPFMRKYHFINEGTVLKMDVNNVTRNSRNFKEVENVTFI